MGVFGGGAVAGVPVIVIIFLAVAVVAYFVLNRTTFGRSIYAVGGNPLSAWLSGVRVQNVLLSSYAISGFLAGLAGFLIMSRLLSANMTAVVNLEMDSIAAVVIGGVSLRGGIGGVVGVVIGILILTVVQNGMVVVGVDAAYQQIVKGAIILLAVAIDYIRRR